MERRFTVLAGASRNALIVLLLLVAPSFAEPKSGPAKVHFDRGVTAYSKGDFTGAAAAFAKSFGLKADQETLFAWAQAERRLEHCEKALELYAKLLKYKMPAANKDAVVNQIGECKDIIAAKKKAAEPPPDPTPVKEPEPPPPDVKPDPVTEQPERDPDPKPVDPVVDDKLQARASETHSWWKDPIGDTLLGLGVASLGVGAYFMVSANSAENAKAEAKTYTEYEDLDNKAIQRGQIGMIALASGGVLLVTSFAWYATHRKQDSRGAVITGWFAPDSGGLAIGGGF